MESKLQTTSFIKIFICKKSSTILIIIITFLHANLRPERLSRFAKKASTIQYGYEKWATHSLCFPKHLRRETARMKQEKETEGDGKKRAMNIWKVLAGMKKIRPDGLTV